MKLLFRKVYWWFYIVILSLRWVKKINLCDKVIYNNKVYIVMDGVYAPNYDIKRYDLTFGRDPVWGDIGHDKDKEGNPTRIRVNINLLRKVRSLRNYWGSFKSGYDFYMTNWYEIWIYEGIKPWMRGCNIGGINE